MKTRHGLVSNSSSSSFILDGRDPEVVKLMRSCIAGDLNLSLGRSTGWGWGLEAIDWANEWIASMGDYYKEPNGIGHQVLKYAKEFGEENIIFLLESDEGMGGSLFEESSGDYYDSTGPYADLRRLSKIDMEYH